MRFEFSSKELARLYSEPDFVGRFPPGVVDAFLARVQYIVKARDERDLYAWKSLRYKRLLGSRSNQRSMRLNAQWRLILELRKDDDGTVVVLISIEDYHD